MPEVGYIDKMEWELPNVKCEATMCSCKKRPYQLRDETAKKHSMPRE